MSNVDLQELFNQRLGRYQAAIAMEPLDRMPVACGSNYFAEVYSGNTNQQTIYDPAKWLEAEMAFIRDFPEVDVLRNSRIYAPMFDAVNCLTYRLPGRDLPARTQFQFVEQEYMKADEYDQLIENPTLFLINTWLPRIMGELATPGSARATMALIKAGMTQMQMGEIMRTRGIRLQNECGMPQPMAGFFLAPFDAIADAMRGLTATMMDMYRQPEKLKQACDALVDEMVNLALSTGDPFRRYPIFVPTHKPMFLSPEQFDEFYWPSFKAVLQKLHQAGYAVRAYLEGDWGQHWKHLLELPKGSVLCDIDSQGDIFKALDELGHHQCLAGGVADSVLILGTPQEMREQVKRLCEAAGKDKRLLINGGCNIPYDTKPENYRAMLDAIMEFGQYDSSLKPTPKPEGIVPFQSAPARKVLTSWETRKAEWGGVQGDEALIREPWERFEAMAYAFIWQWVL